MSRSITLVELQTAIERLRPELPALLESDYSAFMAELETSLSAKNIYQLLDLFGRYPPAHNLLLDTLEQQREDEANRGIRPFGVEKTDPPRLYYRCKKGPHVVELVDVEKRTASGDALCPQHFIAMILIKTEELRVAIERLRPELPDLLGTKYTIFIEELDFLLGEGSSDQIAILFNHYPAAHKRLMEVLV